MMNVDIRAGERSENIFGQRWMTVFMRLTS
jgi:hypothetical protein